MKKVLFVLLIIPLLSGCIEMRVEEGNPLISIPTYDEDAIIDHIQFNLPQKQSMTNISLSLYNPEGISGGTFSQTFYNTKDCKVNIQRTSLYYPGTWKVEFNINDEITGSKYFWVESLEHDLDVYTIENYMDLGTTINFNVYNVGKEAGWVEILVFNTNPFSIGGRQVYGKLYFESDEYIRPGHRFEARLTITETSDLTIMINGDEYKFGE